MKALSSLICAAWVVAAGAANTKAQTAESIAVTVDHDLDVTLALVIRLDAAGR